MELGPGGAPEDNRADEQRPNSVMLRRALIGTDVLALTLAWSGALVVGPFTTGRIGLRSAEILVLAVGVGLLAMRQQGLMLARVCSVRSIEISRIGRSMLLAAVALLVIDRIANVGVSVPDALLGVGLGVVFLVVGRSAYRGWIGRARERGRFRRRVVFVGSADEAARLARICSDQTSLGISVVGFVGSRADAQVHGLGSLWLGDVDDAERLIARAAVSGVILCMDPHASGDMNALLRRLSRTEVHVQLSTGVAGIDVRRLRSLPLAHEPLFYVEGTSLRRSQLLLKRTFDVVLSVLGLVMLWPVFAAVALAIKLRDRGPVFFRQERVGRHGRTFELIKFRTMVVDAEQQLCDLAARNERSGPLFKLSDDPRVTRLGRFLRESSLDELPQLLNVIRGEMSLVGPRPALPSEVASFDADLRTRESVLPGITGLWQVESRDNPSFESYRRLDLFYVENWSLAGDVAIAAMTLEHLMVRVISTLAGRRRRPTQSAAAQESALASGSPREVDAAA